MRRKRNFLFLKGIKEREKKNKLCLMFLDFHLI
jgi:hypothetical protein